MIVREALGRVEALAPAKLNLFLEVLGKRSDGYHEIETLMVATDWYDTLRFEDDESGEITLDCDDPGLPTGEENLVVRAALALKRAAGCPRGARISLTKTIPSGAGLAGGSSDAAATLRALDRLWGLEASDEALNSLAGAIGSDVAFFLGGPAAVCRGRGERVEPLDCPRPLSFVVLAPRFGVSTASVYRNLTPPETPRPIGAVQKALKEGDVEALGSGLFNRLQPVAEAIEPRLGPVREALEASGPSFEGHLMSGSGSAYFGLCRDDDAAGHAARRLERLGLGRVRVVTCGP